MSEKKVNILLVEDDYLDIMNVERELGKISVEYPLHVARNGREALDMLRGEGVPKISPVPSVILLDINMPKMNGMEFLAELRRDPEFSHIPVFIMTTSNEDTDRLAAQRLNVSGYIVKPLSFDSFERSHSSLDSFSLFLDLIKLK
ncbi:response regulator receiver domain-containing protein [Pontibacter ummariensis]|uniref:Response regulator receiver domain-containing protein n=1 Tax=Pontibacter ummariensis TaxID=1610492 RepID=A0A239E8H7_9BACT|nr:response regulator [Pontibacter ummariensis]PRY13131.1 response regulator receiver domain-containing protein [Pontibacter ummariensis]SNS40789.1 Response regulator receiver domain-containing protein [Pontibacter ummariensis]